MVFVKGNVVMFGLELISFLGLWLIFVLLGLGVIELKYFFVLKLVEVMVVVDGFGVFIVNFVLIDNVYLEWWYMIWVEWFDSVINFIQFDFIDWKLYVFIEGGDFVDFIEYFLNL